MARVVLPLLAALVAACGATGAEREAVFPSRPRVAYTAAELTAWNADPTRAAERRSILAQADDLLRTNLYVPVKEGQWVFYYACPKDGAHLKAESLEKHVCPACGAVYTDERTVAAYRTILNDRLNADCYTLALAYALTGDAKYAAPVRVALLELARVYPTLSRHDRWGRTGLLAVVGGRRYCQLLDEAVSAIKLGEAYDLVAGAGCFSDADRKTVEEQLLGATVREIMKYQLFAGSRNNHQTWFNASYAVVGLAIGDAGLMREAIDGAHGLVWQLANSVTAEGVWYEGTTAYHFYALQAIQDTVDAARRIGWDFSKDARLKSLWLGPLRMAYPNGQMPVIHDSDPTELKRYKPFYKWAYDYFKDPLFAVYAGIDIPGAPKRLQPGSAAMEGIGIVALRRGAEDGAVCAMIDYGMHGDSHGHPDKLNLLLYALGAEYLLDPGRISYSVPEYKSWCRTTVAHNTVVIDERDQEPTTGELWHFGETPEYAACLCASADAYPGYEMKRFLVLTDTWLADVFAVSGTRKARLDWVIHCRGPMTANHAMKKLEEALGRDNGYQHLASVSQVEPGASSAFVFQPAGGKPLKVLLCGDEASLLFAGDGIGYTLKDKVPFLMRRRETSAAVFVAVYDFSGTNAVAAVSEVPLTCDGKAMRRTDGIGLKIATKEGGLTTLGLDLRKTPAGATAVDGRAFERMLFVRTDK